MVVVAISVVITFGQYRAGELMNWQEICFIVTSIAMMATALFFFVSSLALVGMGKVTKVNTITNRRFETIREPDYGWEDEEEFDAGDQWHDYDTPDGIVSTKSDLPPMSDEQYKQHFKTNPPSSVGECKRLIKKHKKLGNGKAVGALNNIRRSIDSREKKNRRGKIENSGGERRAPMDMSPSPTVRW